MDLVNGLYSVGILIIVVDTNKRCVNVSIVEAFLHIIDQTYVLLKISMDPNLHFTQK